MRIRSVDIDSEVEDILRRGAWAEGGTFHLPAGKLDRALYVKVDKVLSAIGGKWDRKAQGHFFLRDGRDALQNALAEGSIVDQKKTLEQFFTPADLAERMVKWLEVADGTHVLEPSAGSGRLAEIAINYGASVTAIEIDPALTETIWAAGCQRLGWLRVYQADFMTWKKPTRDESNGSSWFPADIDAVLMNPPFSANQDIAHVTRALNFLRPGGKLAAIMSPHFTFSNDRASREFCRLIGYEAPLGRQPDNYRCVGTADVASCNVETLPPGTFKESGTNVSAVLVLIEKAG